jgi:hypothetical protein
MLLYVVAACFFSSFFHRDQIVHRLKFEHVRV